MLVFVVCLLFFTEKWKSILEIHSKLDNKKKSTHDCQNKTYGNQALLLNCQLLLAQTRSYWGHRVSCNGYKNQHLIMTKVLEKETQIIDKSKIFSQSVEKQRLKKIDYSIQGDLQKWQLTIVNRKILNQQYYKHTHRIQSRCN